MPNILGKMAAQGVPYLAADLVDEVLMH